MKNLSPVRTYEELEGAEGREVFFRPQRHKSSDLQPLQVDVRLKQEESEWACELVDVAQGGVAVRRPVSRDGRTASGVVSLLVRVDGQVLHEGEARVATVRQVDGDDVLGCALLGEPLDIDSLLQLRDLRNWKPSYGDSLGLQGAPWAVRDAQDFRAAVSTFRLFLEDAQAQLDALEASLPWPVIHGDGPPPPDSIAVHYAPRPNWVPDERPARAALIERIRAEFVPVVLEHYATLDAAMRNLPADQQKAAKQFSMRHLHALMMPAPLLNRAYTKPLGYAGDFECMNYMYFRPFEGNTLYAKALHLASCASLPACAVRARKDLVKRQILGALQVDRGDELLRVAAIAAGPAQEIFELLRQAPLLRNRLEIILFDQDRSALSLAQRRLAPLVERRGGQVKLVVLNDSIKRLLHDPTLFSSLGPVDVLFSTGLFDYLKRDLAATLVGNFYASLAPGGRALIGNMAPHNPCRWVFEHHLEWQLLYRSQDAMLEFGAMGAPTADLSIEPDATGLNPFLVVHKR